MEEVDQSGIGSSPQEMPNSFELEDRVPNRFEEKKWEEEEEDRSGNESVPQEMVGEKIAEVIPHNVLETHTDAKLITQEIEEWQDAVGAKIEALIEDEIWEIVLYMSICCGDS